MAKKRTMKGPPAIHVSTVPSSSDPTKEYEIRISRVDGRLYCTCRAWGIRKTCKHVNSTTRNEILDALEEACQTGVLGI